MKKICILAAILFASTAFCQNTKISFGLNSGLFYYGGNGAEKNSTINNHTYTNDIYGKYPALSYGIFGDLKHTFKKGFITGIGLGVENLRSKVNIVSVWETDVIQASGKSILSNKYINVYPYLGYRIKSFRNGRIDATAGFDVAYILSSNEKGAATDVKGVKYTTSVDRKNIKWDNRSRVQLSATYKKAGIYIGYAHGFADYYQGMFGSNQNVHSRFIRMGVFYEL